MPRQHLGLPFATVLGLFAATVATAPIAAVAAAAPLTVGVAETEITPPQGFPMAGYYHERLAEGMIDPLKAKAIVFRQGDRAAAMVVCDLTGIARDLCEEVRKRAAEKTGISAAAIAVSATHSHTAPDYSRHLYQFLQGDCSPVGKVDPAAPPYAEKLIDGIVRAIVDADRDRTVVGLAAGSAVQQTPVSFNRRFVMRDGSVQTWRKLSDPGVVRTAGPIDPEIGFLAILDASGQPRGVLSTFALHLDTVGGLRWSGDYPSFIEQTLRKKYGPTLVSVFGAGCCGDINHSDPNRTERNRTDMIGTSLGATLEAGLAQGRRLENTRLQARSMTVALPLQNPGPEQIDRSRQLLRLIRDGGKVDFLDQVAAYKTLMLAQFRPATRRNDDAALLGWGLSHAWAGVGDTLPVDVQTITLGDEVGIVFLPGEVFVDLGLAIKQASPFRTTLVIELSNCVETVYIPTRAATAGGSYEVTNSTLLPGGGEMLVEAALKLLRESAEAATAR